MEREGRLQTFPQHPRSQGTAQSGPCTAQLVPQTFLPKMQRHIPGERVETETPVLLGLPALKTTELHGSSRSPNVTWAACQPAYIPTLPSTARSLRQALPPGSSTCPCLQLDILPPGAHFPPATSSPLLRPFSCTNHWPDSWASQGLMDVLGIGMYLGTWQ